MIDACDDDDGGGWYRLGEEHAWVLNILMMNQETRKKCADPWVTREVGKYRTVAEQVRNKCGISALHASKECVVHFIITLEGETRQ
jgi:hypothetical protein